MSAPNFQFTDGAEVQGTSAAPGGSTLDPVANVDIKVVGLIHKESLAKVLGVAATELQSFWCKDEAKTPKFPSMKNTKLKSVHQDMIVRLGDLTFNKATVKQMTFVCVDNENASLQMTIGVLGISDEDNGHLASMMSKSQECLVSPMQQDLLDEQEAPEEI